jgi:hypothetical protein
MLARPLRTRLTLTEEGDATPIELPRRGGGAAGLIVAGMFVVFAAVWVIAIRGLDASGMRSVGDLAGLLFRLFWILGWSIGVAVLGVLTVLFLFYRESLYLAGGRLLSVPRIGPLRMVAEYDLAGVRNVRMEPEKDGVRVRFDYGEGSRSLGGVMPPAQAERIVAAIRAAAPAMSRTIGAPEPARKVEAEPLEPPPRGSALALVVANLVPLAGVLLAGWRLDQVMVLFWAESAIVAVYTLAKMALVGRWLAIPAGVFFLGHFGAFMAIHFLFVYEIFVRGVHATGREPPLAQALSGVFVPLWPALLALVLSHGLSFTLNFVGRGERRGATLRALMAAPYNRVVLMQLTLIFGGGLALALNDTRPALALLVALKIGADLLAHRRERAASALRSGEGA